MVFVSPQSTAARKRAEDLTVVLNLEGVVGTDEIATFHYDSEMSEKLRQITRPMSVSSLFHRSEVAPTNSVGCRGHSTEAE
jgi:hypothetical protein